MSFAVPLIRNGVAVNDEGFLPYCAPLIGEDEIAEVIDTLRSGFLSTGPKVCRFEDDFARYVCSERAIALSSCTAALTLALAALDIGPGDEVIVPSLTFCATANVVEHMGATTVLVDVSDEMQIDPKAVARAISTKTRAIIAVHYGGQACDLASIQSLAKQRRIPVIEDAAHASGATYHGRKIGSCSLMTAFSFYPTKNMTTGEGGMLTTNDVALAEKIRLLASHGRATQTGGQSRPNAWQYEVTHAGYKANMTDIQAAIGIHQLKRLDGFLLRRRQIAQRYASAFADLSELLLPGDLPQRPNTFHLYPLRILPHHSYLTKATLMSAMLSAGIGTSIHFTPLHRQPFYCEKYRYLPGAFPVADALFDQLVSIPLYPAMSDSQVNDVIQAVRRIVLTSRKQPGVVVESRRNKQCAPQLCRQVCDSTILPPNSTAAM